MSYKFSKKSKEKLSTVHPDLQKICNELIELMDVTILEGIRTKERQEELVRTGMSKTMNSKHLLGKAVDVAPYPIDWADRERFIYMQGMIRGISHVLKKHKMIGSDIRSGIDWDSDGNIKDHSFFDGPHFEIK